MWRKPGSRFRRRGRIGIQYGVARVHLPGRPSPLAVPDPATAIRHALVLQSRKAGKRVAFITFRPATQAVWEVPACGGGRTGIVDGWESEGFRRTL